MRKSVPLRKALLSLLPNRMLQRKLLLWTCCSFCQIGSTSWSIIVAIKVHFIALLVGISGLETHKNTDLKKKKQGERKTETHTHLRTRSFTAVSAPTLAPTRTRYQSYSPPEHRHLWAALPSLAQAGWPARARRDPQCARAAEPRAEKRAEGSGARAPAAAPPGPPAPGVPVHRLSPPSPGPFPGMG